MFQLARLVFQQANPCTDYLGDLIINDFAHELKGLLPTARRLRTACTDTLEIVR